MSSISSPLLASAYLVVNKDRNIRKDVIHNFPYWNI